jgi:hypothetical protein
MMIWAAAETVIDWLHTRYLHLILLVPSIESLGAMLEEACLKKG